MREEINISTGRGKDRVSGIQEIDDEVIVSYTSGNQTRQIIVSMNIINFVESVINQMNSNEKYKSKYLYRLYIKNYRIKSEIIKEYEMALTSVLKGRDMSDFVINGILDELDSLGVTLMSFKEMIGSRKVETSHYFKVYASIRYFEKKGRISYSSAGTIQRLN